MRDEDEQKEPLVKSSGKGYGVKETKVRKDSTSSYGSTQNEGDGKSKKKKKSKSVSIRKLFRYATCFDRFLIVVGSLFSFIHGAGWPILAIIFGNMTNTFVDQAQGGFLGMPVTGSNFSLLSTVTTVQDVSTTDMAFSDELSKEVFQTQMNTFALYYVYIGAVVFLAASMQVLCWTMSCERQIYRLRQEFLYQVLRQEIAWFDRHQSGELAMKLNDDIERIREGIGDKFGMLIQHTSTFVAGFLVGFYKGWELTLVIMSLTPLVALTSAFMGKLIATSSAREQAKYAIAGGVAEEVLGCIRTVTSFCGQKREIKRYTEALTMGKDIAIKKYYAMALGLGLTFLILYGTYSLAFWYGSELILSNKMDAGSVFTVFFAVMIGSFSLGNATPNLVSINQAQGSAQSIHQILDQKPRIDAYSDKGVYMDQFKANIEFRNVSFSYPTRKGVPVLRNLNLQIKEGQTVALCGASGSGKSTVVSLLLRFYDPLAGHITLNGYSLQDLNLRWLRTIIGVVSQEPVLFGCSIEENIRYGRNDVTFLEICDAARMANAHEFISGLPSGYDTLVGDRGAQLSGGQKQRIAIARALVRDPKILLLDEATSALDSESEATVQLALDKAREGRTTIVIAHRLSTIRNADVIYAIENGSVVEQGTHDLLMDKEGVYYQLVMNQMFTDETGYSTSEQGGDASDTLLKKTKEQIVRRRSSVKGNSYYYDKDPNVMRLADEAETEDVEIPSGLKILRAAAPEFKPIFCACLASMLTGGTMPVFAIFYGEIFNTFTLVGEELRDASFFWSMMFLVLAVATALGNYFRTLGFAYSGENLTMRLRLDAFSNVLRQDIGWFDEDIHSSGKIATRLASDVPVVKTAAGHRLGVMVSAVVTLGTSLILAFIFGWQLALALTASVPILLAVGAMEMRVMKGNQKRDAELMADAGRVVTEALENIRTVQAITQEPLFLEKYLNHLLLPFMENKKNSLVYAAAFAFSQGIIFFIYAAAFWFGSYLIANEQMQPVNVYRVFFAMAFSAVSVGQWTSYLPDYTKAKLSAGLIFKMIEINPGIDSYSEGGVRPVIKGEVTFSDVHFYYPSRTRAKVLQGLSLSVKSGQTIALIGPSGCGKSTLVSLLQRFYDPQMGQVKVDDFDIRTVNLHHLRSHMAVVSQEPVLFHCSIRENIMYGVEGEVTQHKIEQAARTANIHDFIASLPLGYDTMVGERGAQLSGGQKQRIAIARALVRDPKILLLDEATSALDTESEKLVQEALDKARQGRTCIVIAHRLSTVQNADCIVVVDKGKVAELGTHEQLLAKKGTYYKLTKKQRIKKN